MNDRKKGLLFLVLVFLEGLRTGQCLNRRLLPVEGVHLLLQVSPLLIHLPLLFLVHSLQLLKLLVQLRE